MFRAFCCCCFESFFNRCFLDTLSSRTIRLWQERSHSGFWIPCFVYLTFRFWFKERIFVIRSVKGRVNYIEKYMIIIIKCNFIQIKKNNIFMVLHTKIIVLVNFIDIFYRLIVVFIRLHFSDFCRFRCTVRCS